MENSFAVQLAKLGVAYTGTKQGHNKFVPGTGPIPETSFFEQEDYQTTRVRFSFFNVADELAYFSLPSVVCCI